VLAGYGGSARAARLDPVGVWSCLIYGRPGLGDERAFVRLDADGTAALARMTKARRGRWLPLSDWRKRRHRIEFSDPVSGREFEADLDSASLGGGWKTATLAGGWWCSRVDAGASAVLLERAAPPEPARWLPELEPVLIASPRYPREAIREAREGRAVGCFSVNADGEIVDAELVELSDEIFREPTLAALAGSRYEGWEDDRLIRPACRSFVFRLETVY
jgi:hypothetical protein